MNFTCIFFGTIFSLVGALFAAGRLHAYLSAWKHMPAEEKEKINILPLCRNIGQVILLSGVIFLLNGFFPSFQGQWFTVSMVVWMIAAILDLMFISKSHKFEKK